MVPANNEKITTDPDGISLKELILKIQEWWQFLLSKWKAIVIAGIIGGVLGLAYAVVKKPIYKAELSFALQDDKPAGGLGSALGLASQFGLDMGGGSVGGEFAGDNLLELMKSRSMVTRALLTPVVLKNKKQTLADYYIDFSDLRKNWQNRPEVRNIHFLPGENASKFTLHQDSVLSLLYKSLIKNNLNVDKEDKKLNIITVTVNSTDELFSKEFAEVLTKEVSDFYIQTKTEKSSKNVAVLQRQTDSVRQMLNGAITGVATSLDVNPNPNPLLATLRVPSQHRQIDVQANSAILTQLVTNLEIAKMSLLQATPLIQVIDRPILPLEKQNVKKTIGIALGGILVAFLTACFLLMKKIFSDALK